jgi:ATP-dependent RNA circularization protein (DNA/RNA ligase family)
MQQTTQTTQTQKHENPLDRFKVIERETFSDISQDRGLVVLVYQFGDNPVAVKIKNYNKGKDGERIFEEEKVNIRNTQTMRDIADHLNKLADRIDNKEFTN